MHPWCAVPQWTKGFQSSRRRTGRNDPSSTQERAGAFSEEARPGHTAAAGFLVNPLQQGPVQAHGDAHRFGRQRADGTGTWINRLLPVGGHRPIRAETSAVGAGTSSPSSRRASIAVASASDACWAMSPGVVATDATSGKSGDSSDQAPAASSHSAVIGYSRCSMPCSISVRAPIPSRLACKSGEVYRRGCRPSGPQRQPCGHPGGRCDAIPCRLARRSPRAAAAASLHGPSPAYFGRCATNPIPIGEMRCHGTACITELRSAPTPRCSSPPNPPPPAKPAAAGRTPSRSPPAPESHPPPPMRPTRPA